MEIIKKTQHTANDSTYKSITIQEGKTHYSIMKVEGKFNYVNVLKLNMPFKSPGKHFDNFNQAQVHYKNGTLKSMILIAELEFQIDDKEKKIPFDTTKYDGEFLVGVGDMYVNSDRILMCGPEGMSTSMVEGFKCEWYSKNNLTLLLEPINDLGQVCADFYRNK